MIQGLLIYYSEDPAPRGTGNSSSMVFIIRKGFLINGSGIAEMYCNHVHPGIVSAYGNIDQ